MNGRAARSRREGEVAQEAAAAELAKLVQLKVRLTTGRPVLLAVPVDLTAIEAVDLIGYIARGMPEQLAQARAATAVPSIVRRPALIVPGH